MARIDELRAEVRKRQQAVNRKLRRYDRNGIELSGTEHDPRRPGVDISRMRSRDLTSYLNRLNGFMSRSTQFVGDRKGRPIAMSEWRRYKRAETAANRRADRLYNTIKDIKMPGGQMTLGQRHAAVTNSDFPITANHTVNSPLHKVKRAPRTLENKRALNKFTKQQQRKVDPQFAQMTVNRGRREAYKMLAAVGDMAEIRALKGLTDKQFHILWSYTEYATLKSTKYENGKVDVRTRAEDEIDESVDAESAQWVRWAKELKPQGTSFTPRKKKRGN